MSTTGKLRLPTEAEKRLLEMWDRDFFRRPWTDTDWRNLDETRHLLVAWEKDQNLIGFGLYGTLPGDEAAHMYKIFILPEWRGKDEARLFFEASTQELRQRGFKKVYLEVEMSNPRGIGFYEKVGFRRLRTIRAYYSDGTDGLTMELAL